MNIIKRKKPSYKSQNSAKVDYNYLIYSKALKTDKRTIFQTFISFFTEKLEIIQLTFYPKEFSHISLTLSLYNFEILLDLTINSLLFSDDVISQKYYNNGQLYFFTSNILSISSNIIVCTITYLIGKLINYYEALEAAKIETNKNIYILCHIIFIRNLLHLLFIYILFYI